MCSRPFFLLLMSVLYFGWAIPGQASWIDESKLPHDDPVAASSPTPICRKHAEEMWLVDAGDVRHLIELSDRLHRLRTGFRAQPLPLKCRTICTLQDEIAYHKESADLLSQIQTVLLKAQPHPVPSPQRYILLAEGAFYCGGCTKSRDLSAEYDLVARDPSKESGLLASAQVSLNLLLSALRHGKVEAGVLDHTRSLHLGWQGPISGRDGTSPIDHTKKSLPLQEILGFFPNLHSITLDRDMPLMVLEAIGFSLRAHYGRVLLNVSHFFYEIPSMRLGEEDMALAGDEGS